MAKTLTRVETDNEYLSNMQLAIEAAIAAQNAKAETVARKGRMQYAIKALTELGTSTGLFTIASNGTAAKSDEPKVLLTDKQKAERIIERNATKGWKTSRAVELVASGEAETFELGKQLAQAQQATAEKATPAPKPAKRAAK